MTELTCQELVELVTDYLDDALPAAERARFEAHLADCEGCEAYVDQMRTTIRLTASSDELAAHPGVEGLMPVFREWKRSKA